MSIYNDQSREDHHWLGVQAARRYAPPSYGRPVVRYPTPKRRFFRWLFLAIQLGFVGWIVDGLVSTSSDLHKCGTDVFSQVCKDAVNTGRGAGVAIIVAIWVALDMILGMTWLVWRQEVSS